MPYGDQGGPASYTVVAWGSGTEPFQNKFVGAPRVQALTLVNYIAQHGDNASLSSQTATGESQVSDAIFFNVPQNIMEDARENISTYHTSPPYEKVNTIVSTTLQM